MTALLWLVASTTYLFVGFIPASRRARLSYITTQQDRQDRRETAQARIARRKTQRRERGRQQQQMQGRWDRDVQREHFDSDVRDIVGDQEDREIIADNDFDPRIGVTAAFIILVGVLVFWLPYALGIGARLIVLGSGRAVTRRVLPELSANLDRARTLELEQHIAEQAEEIARLEKGLRQP
jgi:hypothetical protein